jgi:hypothetical protein
MNLFENGKIHAVKFRIKNFRRISSDLGEFPAIFWLNIGRNSAKSEEIRPFFGNTKLPIFGRTRITVCTLYEKNLKILLLSSYPHSCVLNRVCVKKLVVLSIFFVICAILLILTQIRCGFFTQFCVVVQKLLDTKRFQHKKTILNTIIIRMEAEFHNFSEQV